MQISLPSPSSANSRISWTPLLSPEHALNNVDTLCFPSLRTPSEAPEPPSLTPTPTVNSGSLGRTETFVTTFIPKFQEQRSLHSFERKITDIFLRSPKQRFSLCFQMLSCKISQEQTYIIWPLKTTLHLNRNLLTLYFTPFLKLTLCYLYLFVVRRHSKEKVVMNAHTSLTAHYPPTHSLVLCTTKHIHKLNPSSSQHGFLSQRLSVSATFWQ